MAAPPAFIVQSLFFGSFIPTLCPSKLVPGNKATNSRSPGSSCHHRTLQVRTSITPTPRHIAPNGNKNSMSRKHKQKLDTAELQTNSPARWIRKKKGDGDRIGAVRHHFALAPSAITECRENRCNSPFTKQRSSTSSCHPCSW